jgi:iron complex outermembrane receptor protein
MTLTLILPSQKFHQLILKSIKYLIFLLLIQHTAFAQNSIKGKVIDKDTKEPLFEVVVYIPDLKVGTATDTLGEFVFNNLPTGKFLIQVKLIGYATQVLTANTADIKPMQIMLSQAAGELQEVVVTGVSKGTEIRRSPVPIVAVDGDYLQSIVANNAIDAITKVPGVVAVTTGPNISKPFIRGLGYNRILTLYDGMRQEGQQRGDEHGIEVDQFGIERVEVIKGPASLSYGSDALAGAVNLIPTQPAPEGKMLGDITTLYTTNNREIGLSGMLEGTKKGVDWVFRVSHKQAQDYIDKYDGRVFNTAFSETDASGSVGVHRNWGYSHFSFSAFSDLQEIPDGSRDSATRLFTRQITEIDTARQIVSNADLNTYKIEKLHQHVQHYRFYNNNSFRIGNAGSIDANVAYQYSQRQEFDHPVLYTIPGLYLQLHTLNFDFKYNMPEKKAWNFSTGINGMYQMNTVTQGTNFVIPSYQQFDIGAFAIAKRHLGKFDLEAGIRYDVRDFDNSQLYVKPNPSDSFNMPVYGSDTVGGQKLFSALHALYQGVTGSVGATYNINNQLCLKLNVARGYRAPNIAEISANGVHPGTNIYQIGNASFKPEFNVEPDFGIAYNSKYVVFSVDVFYNYIQNYIYNQKLVTANGQDSVVVPGNLTFKFSAASAQLYGGEVSIDVHPVKSLHFDNGLSLVYADFLGVKGQAVPDSERYLPQIPPLHGYSELRYDFNLKKLHMVNGFFKVGITYDAAQNRYYSAYGTETYTPGYVLLNAGIATSFTNKKGKTIMRLTVLGDNLTNKAYQDNLSRLKYFDNYPINYTGRSGIYNMGANVVLKLNFPLEFAI